ncbi:Uma2 family endonuclease [Myxococcota bacterium]|nr:Uma2 family endonuclease [Myxococcota bacterium]
MTAALEPTIDDYLDTEADAPSKREFAGGEIIAMAGAEPEHNVVRESLSAQVWASLRGRPCRSFSADQRVNVGETEAYFYPDVVIVCDPPRFVGPRPRSLQNPSAWFEVLSPSTESWDRGGKFAHARRCASLRIYALIDPVDRRVEWYTRGEGGRWAYQSVEREGSVTFEGLDVTLDVATLFATLEGLDAAP